MTFTTNGHKPTATIEQASDAPTPATSHQNLPDAQNPQKRRAHHNKWVSVSITIDAGARFVKTLVGGQFSHFPSVYRIADDTLPLNLLGCFTWNASHYAVGAVADMVEGQMERASNANKIDKIHLWVLGALTHNTKLLSELQASKKRLKEPVRLKLDITMLTLSSALQQQIRASLEAIDSFTWEGQEFKVAIDSLKILPEGYGSAVTISAQNPDVQRFHILDLGGGTLTLTEYQASHGRPAPIVQKIANGGGISSIITSIQIGLSKSDKSGARIIPELIQESLKASTEKECIYLFGNKPKNIASSVKSAMDDWLADNPQCQNILSFALAALLRDEHLYLTGGGFACLIVKAWVAQWLSKGCGERGHIEVLPDCYKINLTGC